jgi:hypothetical protein
MKNKKIFILIIPILILTVLFIYFSPIKNKILDNKSILEVEDTKSVIDCDFSPDKEHFACIVNLNDSKYVIYDGKTIYGYDGDYEGRLVFSPDSKHFAYTVKHDNKYYVIYDGQKSEGYDEIIEDDLSFTSDSKNFIYIAKQGDKYYVVYDNKKIDE